MMSRSMILALSLGALALGPTTVPTAPIPRSVETTTVGYALIDSGLGNDRNQVQAYERTTQAPTVEAKTRIGFQPTSIKLTMTGLRVDTGLRIDFQPRTITTGELTMTGMRNVKPIEIDFQPRTITTGELTMTGMRNVKPIEAVPGR